MIKNTIKSCPSHYVLILTNSRWIITKCRCTDTTFNIREKKVNGNFVSNTTTYTPALEQQRPGAHDPDEQPPVAIVVASVGAPVANVGAPVAVPAQ